MSEPTMTKAALEIVRFGLLVFAAGIIVGMCIMMVITGAIYTVS